MERWEYEQFIIQNVEKLPLDLLKTIFYLFRDYFKRRGM